MTKANITAWCNEKFKNALNALNPTNNSTHNSSNNNSNNSNNNSSNTTTTTSNIQPNNNNGYRNRKSNKNSNNNNDTKNFNYPKTSSSSNESLNSDSSSSSFQQNISTTEQSSSIQKQPSHNTHELITITPNFLQTLPYNTQAVLSELPPSPKNSKNITEVQPTIPASSTVKTTLGENLEGLSSTYSPSNSSSAIFPKYSKSVENQLDQTAKKVNTKNNKYSYSKNNNQHHQTTLQQQNNNSSQVLPPYAPITTNLPTQTQQHVPTTSSINPQANPAFANSPTAASLSSNITCNLNLQTTNINNSNNPSSNLQKPSSSPSQTSSPSSNSNCLPSFCSLRFKKRGLNKISTRKYTAITFIPKFLYEQFTNLANVWFFFVSIAQQIPGVSPTGKLTTAGPLIFILIISAIREIYEDFKRYREDKKINRSKTEVWTKKNNNNNDEDNSDNNQNGCWKEILWQDLRPGDIIKISKDKYIPADVILLRTSENLNICHIETSNLDGETNLKLRQADQDVALYFDSNPEEKENSSKTSNIPDSSAAAKFNVEKPNKDLYKFAGSANLPKKTHPGYDIADAEYDMSQLRPLSPTNLLLRGSKLKNTKYAIGFVTYTGSDSKIMKNSSSLPIKISNVQKQTNIQIGYLFIIMITMSVVSIIGTMGNLKLINPDKHFYIMGPKFPPAENPDDMSIWYQIKHIMKQLLTFLILYNAIVPISLIVTLEIVKVYLAGFVSSDLKMYDEESKTFSTARTSNLVEELGQVKYIFSDKTGTLTRNVMEFKFASIYGHDIFDYDDRLKTLDKNREFSVEETLFFRMCAACHTVVPEKSETSSELLYQASSPDEGALVKAAANLGFNFFERTPTELKIKENGIVLSFEILATIDFTSARQRMSIILRENFGKQRILILTKGSDAIMMPRIVSDTKSTQGHLDEFAKQGLRTLVFGYRELSEKEFNNWNKKFHLAKSLTATEEEVDKISQEIEHTLKLVGISAIEDKLQDKVPETIENLQKCGIHIWMLTGDKIETAQNIGYSSKLLHPEKSTVYVINSNSSKEIKKQLLEIEKREEESKKNQNYYNFQTSSSSGVSSNNGKHAVMVISGESLKYAMKRGMKRLFLKTAVECHTVICARVSPSQKAEVVNLVKMYVKDKDHKKAVTLSIGDGANDVPMILNAHIGVGISGKEGLQAANSSDYSIPQFRFLERLLIVHGVWNYKMLKNF